MKRYEVLISDRANEDIESIYKYIAKTLLEPAIASKQCNKIVEAILSLEEMPERIKLMDSEPERSKGLRSLIVGNYVIFFVVKAERVGIVRILYSASDIGKRLLQ